MIKNIMDIALIPGCVIMVIALEISIKNKGRREGEVL